MRKIIVVDTNILFAVLRAPNTKFRDFLTDKSYHFCSIKFIIVEIFKHKERILASSKSPDHTIYELLNEALNFIELFNEDSISLKNYSKAHLLCREIDEDDTPFVALALELDAELWTNDEKLKRHLKQRGFNRFFEEKF
jgi:predicted nucleic acid-binding protein